MSKNISKKTIGLIAVSFLLIACLGVGSAMAYFTTYAVAQGGYPISLGFTETEIEEEVTDKKVVTIKNTGDFECFIRIKALVGDKYKSNLTYTETLAQGESAKWILGEDGYYYYRDVLKPGETSKALVVSFSFPKDTEASDEFNVIIIQEETKVLYKENGTPYADWDKLADVVQSEYQKEVE